MEWLTCIKSSIEYIEDHLKENINIDEVAKNSYVSNYYLQIGFQIMTGYSIGEYIRNRKLYQAGLDIKDGKKIIDVAFDYGYETPESFTKAYKRFHGFNPSQTKCNQLNRFDPLNIQIKINGGSVMKLNYKIVDMFPLKVIGFVKEFKMETANDEIPKFWDEICQKHCSRIYQGLEPETAYEKAIVNNCIGEYGVCIDCKEDTLKYLIAGKYAGGEVPEGMMVYEFKAGKWAIFDCIGPCPEKIQELNSQIFKEWLPLNKEFELRDEANVEWYDCLNGEKTDANYHTQVWLPIKNIK